MCGGGPDYVERNPYEDELMRVAEKRWNEYQSDYIPLENDMIQQIQSMRGAGYQQSQKDQGVNAARINSPGAITVGAGMQPGGGNFAQDAINLESQYSTASGMGAMAGEQSAEDQYMSGMLGMSQLGRNQQGTALEGTSQLAGMEAGNRMAEMSAKQYASNQKWGALGTVGGIGIGWYGDEQGWWDQLFKKNTPNPGI